MTLRWLRTCLVAGVAAGSLAGPAFAQDGQGAASGVVRIIPIAGTPGNASPTGSEVPIETTGQRITGQEATAQQTTAQAGTAMPGSVPDTTAPTTTMPANGAPRGTLGTMPGSTGPGSTGPGSTGPGSTGPGSPTGAGAGAPGGAPGAADRNFPPPGASPDVPMRHTTGAPAGRASGADADTEGARQRHRAMQEGDRWACHNVKLVYSSPNPDGTLAVKLQNTNDRPVRTRAEFRAGGQRPAASRAETIPPGEMADFTITGVDGRVDEEFAYDHTRPVDCAFVRGR